MVQQWVRGPTFLFDVEGPAVYRDIVSKLSDIVSIKDYGADTGRADNSDALRAAGANNSRVFVPAGVFVTNLQASEMPAMWGEGQLQDNAGNRRGRFFTYLSDSNRPTSFGTHDSVSTAFNGDLSFCQLAVEHRITGTLTLGKPGTLGPDVYTETPECYPHYTVLYNSSGWNQSTSTSDGGRTAAIAYKTFVYQVGQGDAVAYNAAFYVAGTKPGATNTLANPNATCFNGGGTIGSDGASGTGIEIHITGGAYDNSAMGYLIQLERGNATGANYAWWEGFRCQSVGSAAIDTGFQLVGKARFGIDFAFADVSSNGGCIMSSKGGQLWFGNVDANDPSTVSRYPQKLGSSSTPLNNDYFGHDGTDWHLKGGFRFGTYSAKGAEAFAGFMTVKDEATGESRKLMVCA